MRVKMILPALAEAHSPFWRPIKYSLFPPLGLATLAGHFSAEDEIELIDQHVETLHTDDTPDLVMLQVYITNAYRAYAIADAYRQRGVYVILGGLHVTALPAEAALHADSIFTGPADHSFPEFLKDFRNKTPRKIYNSAVRTLDCIPPVRRDLIKRKLYLVPNALVVSRGCPHQCSFCYKKQFYSGGKSYYTRQVDAALAEIESLPGRHLYFLDDHLFGNPGFAAALFEGMKGMNRLFQSAATVESILKGDTIERAAEAGLRSLFVGFETLSPENLLSSNKRHNMRKDFESAIQRLHALGIMINGSFVFGLDYDDADVFMRTVDWGIQNAITTATYHILTPYPGTDLYDSMKQQGRIVNENWDNYDTRHVVYQPVGLSSGELEAGYKRAYDEFYSWKNIFIASSKHETVNHSLRHFGYTGGWKKFEPVWNFIIKTGLLNEFLPLLETVLGRGCDKGIEKEQTIGQEKFAVTQRMHWQI